MAREVIGHWSYSGDPAVSDKDRIRWLVGDVNKDDQLVSDEEIAAALVSAGAVYAASAEICHAIAAFFAREVTKTISAPGAAGQSTTIQLDKRREAYLALATRLEAQSGVPSGRIAVPYCGGISIDDKDTVEDDTDRVAPAFERGQFDYE